MNIVYALIFILIFAAIAVSAPAIIAKRTLGKIIAIFRRHGATDAAHAKSRYELGLEKKGFMKEIMSPSFRDHKPKVLESLISSYVVRITDDGKLYLEESKLKGTRWELKQ